MLGRRCRLVPEVSTNGKEEEKKARALVLRGEGTEKECGSRGQESPRRKEELFFSLFQCNKK